MLIMTMKILRGGRGENSDVEHSAALSCCQDKSFHRDKKIVGKQGGGGGGGGRGSGRGKKMTPRLRSVTTLLLCSCVTGLLAALQTTSHISTRTINLIGWIQSILETITSLLLEYTLSFCGLKTRLPACF